MRDDYCEGHIPLVTTVGRIEEGVNTIKDDVKRLDSRINGVFREIEEHMTEGDDWRQKILKNEMRLQHIAEEKESSHKYLAVRVGLICSIPAFVLMLIKLYEIFFIIHRP